MASRAYTSDYEKASLRGIEELRPWNVTDELAAVSGSLKSLLDIGCGVCRKTLPVASKFREVWGLEPSARCELPPRKPQQIQDLLMFI